MKLHSTQVLIKPLVTEKAKVSEATQNVYLFEVHPAANKPMIKSAVQELFAVEVAEVRTLIERGAPRRIGRFEGQKSSRKKAFVKLVAGSTIDYFEGA